MADFFSFPVSYFFSLGERPGQDAINCSGVLSMTSSQKAAPGSWAKTPSKKLPVQEQEEIFSFSYFY